MSTFTRRGLEEDFEDIEDFGQMNINTLTNINMVVKNERDMGR